MKMEEKKITRENISQKSTKVSGAEGYARSLLEASLDPLVVINPEGKITDVNESTVKVTGVSREQLIGTDFSNYFTEPERAKEGYRKVLKEGEVKDYKLTLKHKSGETTDVLYNASVYKDEKGNIIGIFAAARMLAKGVLEGAEELLSEISYALDVLAFSSNEGYNTEHEILEDMSNHWLKRTVGQLPEVKTAYEAAIQFRELANERKVILKENFKLEEKGETILGTFLSHDCPYRNACIERKKEGKEYVCFRATPFVTAIKLMCNKDYRRDVIFEQTVPGKVCVVRGNPTRTAFKVGLSYKLSRGTVKINDADLSKIGIEVIDSVAITPSRKELSGRKIIAMSYSQTQYPAGMIIINIEDAKSLGLVEKDTVYISKAKKGEEAVLVEEKGEYEMAGIETLPSIEGIEPAKKAEGKEIKVEKPEEKEEKKEEEKPKVKEPIKKEQEARKPKTQQKPVSKTPQLKQKTIPKPAPKKETQEKPKEKNKQKKDFESQIEALRNA